LELKVKGPVLAIALLTSVRRFARFTISELAADWHELVIPQRTMRPSIAPRQWTIGHALLSAASIAPISHTTLVKGMPSAMTDFPVYARCLLIDPQTAIDVSRRVICTRSILSCTKAYNVLLRYST